MMINQITEAAGGRRRRKRVGRGESSGKGKTCGRGHKGCQSRSGGGVHPLSEGGQMPIFRRVPKRGFSNDNFCTRFQIVNLYDLERVFPDGATVDVAALRKTRVVRDNGEYVKLLGQGTLSKKLTVEVHACSSKAREAIEQAGGSVKVTPPLDAAAAWQAKRGTVSRPKAKTKAKAAEVETPAPPAEEAPPASPSEESTSE